MDNRRATSAIGTPSRSCITTTTRRRSGTRSSAAIKSATDSLVCSRASGPTPASGASRAGCGISRAWFTDEEITASLDHLASQQTERGGWSITWAVWTPAIEIEWSGLVTIAALKILRAYGRV